MTARILVAALIVAGSLPVAAQTSQRTCAEEDQRAASLGWAMPSLTGLVRTCEPGVRAPERLSTVNPRYTERALRQKIQGTVVVGVVIGADGAVKEAQVVSSLDKEFGLDQEAINAVKATKFKPGTKDGRPVATFAYFELAFTLR